MKYCKCVICLLVISNALCLGCQSGKKIFELYINSSSEFYINGQLCTADIFPKEGLSSLGESNIRVRISNPDKLCVYDFVTLMWRVVSTRECILELSDDDECAFCAGPVHPMMPSSGRIAFTSSKLHYVENAKTVSRPISNLGEVCEKISVTDKCQKKASTIEFAFQFDRLMRDVMQFASIAKKSGFHRIHICYYYGVMHNDQYEFFENAEDFK